MSITTSSIVKAYQFDKTFFVFFQHVSELCVLARLTSRKFVQFVKKKKNVFSLLFLENFAQN